MRGVILYKLKVTTISLKESYIYILNVRVTYLENCVFLSAASIRIEEALYRVRHFHPLVIPLCHWPARAFVLLFAWHFQAWFCTEITARLLQLKYCQWSPYEQSSVKSNQLQ